MTRIYIEGINYNILVDFMRRLDKEIRANYNVAGFQLKTLNRYNNLYYCLACVNIDKNEFEQICWTAWRKYWQGNKCEETQCPNWTIK